MSCHHDHHQRRNAEEINAVRMRCTCRNFSWWLTLNWGEIVSAPFHGVTLSILMNCHLTRRIHTCLLLPWHISDTKLPWYKDNILSIHFSSPFRKKPTKSDQNPMPSSSTIHYMLHCVWRSSFWTVLIRFRRTAKKPPALDLCGCAWMKRMLGPQCDCAHMSTSYIQKAGDAGDISPPICLDFPPSFKLSMRNPLS